MLDELTIEANEESFVIVLMTSHANDLYEHGQTAAVANQEEFDIVLICCCKL